ncbi:methyl-accepting chemotaxis protein [Piscinibacter sp. HJYY11]|uniref:methyl-accepting chemotaxis protein n=1 Tax=Piscinibacter sp. HJYY11 TaxID=2801333 RepID=UPI00191ED7F8|nr:methyl-accepting chemotaxis protein [Piscinibacter sp. HJYY11]MBL0727699.1 HAMP domain-containing protein [Piscinibacter sp. HJYY11]
MSLNNISVTRKLWGAILLLLAAMLTIAMLAASQAASVQAESARQIAQVHDLVERSAVWKGLTDTAVTRGMANVISSDPAVGELFKENLENDTKKITAIRVEISKVATSDEDKAAMKNVAEKGAVLVAASKKATELVAAGDRAAVTAHVKGEYAQTAAAYLGAIDAFVALQRQKGEQALAAGAQARQRILLAGFGGAVLVIALGMLVAATLVRSIRQPLEESIRVAGAIAEGDLTQTISTTRKDEFGSLMRALQHMNESLGRVVGNVRSSTDSISTASAEIATGNTDLSSRTEQTASNLQQAASSMEQLTGTVRQSADSARQANQLASSAAEVAQRGGSVVAQVVSTMDEINASSKKISDIIGVIDGIAFQTNILALNAAVEAARAGEQGRGFAVVAGEVRSLAQRSAEAAREIKGLIGSSVDKVEAGSRLVADAGATMNEIVGSVQRVTDIIGEITAASTEQSDGIGQINSAVTQLDQMTQQNAALVEESAAAAESLREQAHRLAEVVAVFKVARV